MVYGRPPGNVERRVRASKECQRLKEEITASGIHVYETLPNSPRMSSVCLQMEMMSISAIIVACDPPRSLKYNFKNPLVMCGPLLWLQSGINVCYLETGE